MSEFVNYNKRDVSLPPGCINLIDVLKYCYWPQPSATVAPKTRQVTGTLGDLKKHLTLAIKSPLKISGLTIAPPTGTPAVEIRWSLLWPGAEIDATKKELAKGLYSYSLWPGVEFIVHVRVRQGTPEEKAVREFFERNDLELPQASELSMPVPFPDLPHDVVFRVPKPPANPALLARVLTDLFKECCRLKDDSEILYTLTPTEGKQG